MKEQIISFETAVLAKEKGWDGDFIESHKILTTQSLLQKWIRDVHEIHIVIERIYSGGLYFFKIQKENKNGYFINASRNKWSTLFKTYEEALEIALQQALKLIKNK